MSLADCRAGRGSKAGPHRRFTGPAALATLGALLLSIALAALSPQTLLAAASGDKRKPHARAAAKRSPPKAKRVAKARSPRAAPAPRAAKGHADAGSTFLFHRPANVVPNQQGKLVVFAFRNDDYGGPLATQVGQLFESRGLDVLTGVRPVDTAEQYRDVATQLGLAAYVDGDVRGNDARTRVTVRLRSGFTGRTVWQATFTESRANLAREISDNLWRKLGPAMARACVDAAKPRKRSRNMLRIDAGTPIETVPSRVADQTN